MPQPCWRLLPVGVAASLVLLATPAHALFTGCTPRTAAFDPSTAVVVPAQPAPGTVIYSGLLNAVFVCSFAPPLVPGTDDFVLVGGATAVGLPGTSYQVRRVGLPTLQATGSPDTCGFGAFNDFQSPGMTIFPALAQPGSSLDESSCEIKASMRIEITYVGTGPLTDIPQNSGLLQQGLGWAGVDRVIDGVGQTATAGPIQVIGRTCSLTTKDMFVRLDAASATALTQEGQTTGEKPFKIELTGCENSTSTFAVNATWSYTPLGARAVIENSAPTRPAANVGIQLLDTNGNPIPNGATTLVANVLAGVVSYPPLDYRARYYATGQAGPGLVRGVAQLVLSYQ